MKWLGEIRIGCFFVGSWLFVVEGAMALGMRDRSKVIAVARADSEGPRSTCLR